MDSCRNADGTYNGVKLFARLTGLSEAEIEWTADRLKQLIVAEKKTQEEAKAIVRGEAKLLPWERKTK
jgi:hypothetical protein